MVFFSGSNWYCHIGWRKYVQDLKKIKSTTSFRSRIETSHVYLQLFYYKLLWNSLALFSQVEEPVEPIPSRVASSDRDLLARMFARHDVRETSYHLLAPRVDLHLCDDPGRELPLLFINIRAIELWSIRRNAIFFTQFHAKEKTRQKTSVGVV